MNCLSSPCYSSVSTTGILNIYFIFHNSTQSFLLSMIPFSDQITQFVTLCQLPNREFFFIEIWIFVFTFVNFHKLKDFLQEFLDSLRYTLKNSLNFWIGDQIEKKCFLMYVLFTSQEMLSQAVYSHGVGGILT